MKKQTVLFFITLLALPFFAFCAGSASSTSNDEAVLASAKIKETPSHEEKKDLGAMLVAFAFDPNQ